jgi:hypothetical protein
LERPFGGSEQVGGYSGQVAGAYPGRILVDTLKN